MQFFNLQSFLTKVPYCSLFQRICLQLHLIILKQCKITTKATLHI